MTFEELTFDDFKPRYKIQKPIRLIELFRGIGRQAYRLERINRNFERYRVVEWDKFAIQSYNRIHGTNFTTSDIQQIHGSDLGIVDKDKYCYICCYSFPCQDLSVRGRQKGLAKGDGTRSGLLWEVERLLNECDELPDILVLENVPMLHSKKNMPDFQKWIDFLESKGYSNTWFDMNGVDYGVAQTRNRCFMVSILGDYRFQIPKPFPLELCMADYMEPEGTVAEKFYLADKYLERLMEDDEFIRKAAEEYL